MTPCHFPASALGIVPHNDKGSEGGYTRARTHIASDAHCHYVGRFSGRSGLSCGDNDRLADVLLRSVGDGEASDGRRTGTGDLVLADAAVTGVPCWEPPTGDERRGLLLRWVESRTAADGRLGVGVTMGDDKPAACTGPAAGGPSSDPGGAIRRNSAMSLREGTFCCPPRSSRAAVPWDSKIGSNGAVEGVVAATAGAGAVSAGSGATTGASVVSAGSGGGSGERRLSGASPPDTRTNLSRDEEFWEGGSRSQWRSGMGPRRIVTQCDGPTGRVLRASSRTTGAFHRSGVGWKHG